MTHIRQKIKLFQYINKIIDILLILSAIYLSIIFESLYHNINIIPINYNSFRIEGFLVCLFAFTIISNYIEYNFFYRINNYFIILKNVFFICSLSILLMILVNFLFKASLFYRTTLIILFPFSFILLLVKRVSIKLYLTKIRREGMDYKINKLIMAPQTTFEKELAFQADRRKATTEFIKIVSDLWYDKSIEIVLFKNQVIDKNVSDIMHLHEYAGEFVQKPISIFDSVEILRSISDMALPPSKLDIGKLTYEYHSDTNILNNVKSFVIDKFLGIWSTQDPNDLISIK